jgi:D-amino-acid dehydrogenase
VRVVVIGGGIIGAATALELAGRGVEVTVVERGAVGGGCSYGNAGWLSPSLAMPLPSPGVIRKSLRLLLDPGSPLYIRPTPRLDLLRWLARFARSCTRARFERGTRALVALSRYSLDAYAALDRRRPGSFGFARRGLLLVAETPAGLEEAAGHARTMERHGFQGQVLPPERVRAMAPAIKTEIAGGVLFPGEAHCEPLAAVQALARAAEEAGARFLPATEVFGFLEEGSRVVAARTTRGRLEADRFVLAAGSWSGHIARRLGLRLPILGGKGYSIVVKGLHPAPEMPLKLYERFVALTPRDGSVRLAGTLELVDGDESISPRRLDGILRGAKAVLDLPERPEIVEIWRGLRPCLPDGLPVIGFAPARPNLLVVTGHQMCGLHTAPGTGRLAADLLTGAAPTFDPEPFRADRF